MKALMKDQVEQQIFGVKMSLTSMRINQAAELLETGPLLAPFRKFLRYYIDDVSYFRDLVQTLDKEATGGSQREAVGSDEKGLEGA